MLGRLLAQREAVGFGRPPVDERKQCEGHDGEQEESTKAEGLRREAVDDRRESRADAVTGRDECQCLGAARRVGLLGGNDLGEGVGRTQQGATEREDDDEPPVTGARGRQDRRAKSEPDAQHQHSVSTESVGECRQW